MLLIVYFLIVSLLSFYAGFQLMEWTQRRRRELKEIFLYETGRLTVHRLADVEFREWCRQRHPIQFHLHVN